jgi:hypothetical protein
MVDEASAKSAGVRVRGWRFPRRFHGVSPFEARPVSRGRGGVGKRAVTENFKCKPTGHGTPSVMIMNGTDDPWSRSTAVRSASSAVLQAAGSVSRSQRYFADLNPRHPGRDRNPGGRRSSRGTGALAQRLNVEVELVAIHGGGRHPSAIPSPSAIIGPVARGRTAGSDLGPSLNDLAPESPGGKP